MPLLKCHFCPRLLLFFLVVVFFLTRPLSLSSFPFAPPHFHHVILLRLAVEMTLQANPPRHLLKGYTAQAFEKLKIKHQHPACSCWIEKAEIESSKPKNGVISRH